MDLATGQLRDYSTADGKYEIVQDRRSRELRSKDAVTKEELILLAVKVGRGAGRVPDLQDR